MTPLSSTAPVKGSTAANSLASFRAITCCICSSGAAKNRSRKQSAVVPNGQQLMLVSSLRYNCLILSLPTSTYADSSCNIIAMYASMIAMMIAAPMICAPILELTS